MASSDLIIGLVVIGGGILAYTQGWLCGLNIPQLCPSAGGVPTDAVSAGVPLLHIDPATGTHGAPYPHGGRRGRTGHQGGYADDGYGDDGYYEASAAHISIA